MFSDHVKNVKRFPQVNLFIVAGALVIVCQLVAMAMVADRQVHRASVRDLQRATQQLAWAECVERSTGLSRHGCMSQSHLDSSGDELAEAGADLSRSVAGKHVAIADEGVANAVPDLIRVGVAASR